MEDTPPIDPRGGAKDGIHPGGPSWLVSAHFDLLVFAVPAVVALALVPMGAWLAPSGDVPFPMWVLAVVFVDVAHVWASLYRTYLDPTAWQRWPRLMWAVPGTAFVGAAALASWSLALFWTAIAYLAAFHFVRQQYGWVRLYHRLDRSLSSLDRTIDTLTIYAATVYPLLWWHAHLPRDYVWFLPGDFLEGVVPRSLTDVLFWMYLGLLSVFVVRQGFRATIGLATRPGLVILVATTAACWGVGIITTHSDWAFTVTNVLTHGIPYMGFVWMSCRRSKMPSGTVLTWLSNRMWAFVGLLLALAVLEESLWSWSVWSVAPSSPWIPWVTAVLALPQVTHYVLDGFIWRRPPRPAPIP